MEKERNQAQEGQHQLQQNFPLQTGPSLSIGRSRRFIQGWNPDAHGGAAVRLTEDGQAIGGAKCQLNPLVDIAKADSRAPWLPKLPDHGERAAAPPGPLACRGRCPQLNDNVLAIPESPDVDFTVAIGIGHTVINGILQNGLNDQLDGVEDSTPLSAVISAENLFL